MIWLHIDEIIQPYPNVYSPILTIHGLPFFFLHPNPFLSKPIKARKQIKQESMSDFNPVCDICFDGIQAKAHLISEFRPRLPFPEV